MIRKEGAWGLSNICAGSSNQIQKVLESGIVELLVNVVLQDEAEIAHEALWALSNTTSAATIQQLDALIQKNLIGALLKGLSFDSAKIVVVALEGLDNALKRGKQFGDDRV